MMITSLPILAFLSIMQFLQDIHKQNEKYVIFHGTLLFSVLFQLNLPNFGILANANWDLSFG